jgi:hypothetical protein
MAAISWSQSTSASTTASSPASATRSSHSRRSCGTERSTLASYRPVRLNSSTQPRITDFPRAICSSVKNLRRSTRCTG